MKDKWVEYTMDAVPNQVYRVLHLPRRQDHLLSCWRAYPAGKPPALDEGLRDRAKSFYRKIKYSIKILHDNSF